MRRRARFLYRESSGLERYLWCGFTSSRTYSINSALRQTFHPLLLKSRFFYTRRATSSEIVNNAELNVGSQRTPPAPSPSTGTWLVILKTFPKSQRSKANQRVGFLRSLGYYAHVVDTNYYPNLKRGFLAVAMGPHSKSAAERVLNKVRSVAPESYVKSGW